ncbi:MAG: tryptophan--tRNA ligase [Nanoarchaeota archaeon]|nr:tryptophan--tRNA ligase [Nanoarchaeota archaeon]MBU1321189.1 tryptophan--tRNA ligase [Nanoarchaeota archaeon]MBU1598457.1 tryptophan--tRNA ligase [Nanoarchaeota archaeon]MBU2441390.1 tryptophan--tRNA ligase [Nanoarchaeota archaeon]
MTKIIDPYGSELVEDYTKIIKDFGLDVFTPTTFPEPNRIMRRGVVFAGRDLNIIAKCIKEKKPFYALSGIMPTSPQIHLGNKMVVENLAYFQKHGAITFILIADLEAAAARGVSLEEGRQSALDFHIPAYLALGLDPKKTIFYFQSENKDVVHFAYEAAKKITLNEFKAIYGNADPGRIMSAVTQVGDILYPQFKERMPGIIPVGLDQDPHIRLTRDIVSRMKAKKFFAPSSLYHKYTPSLDGSIKMSKSKPESCINLPEDPKDVCKKIKRALTGGRDTLEEHRKLGAVIEKDMVFELLKQHLIEDDAELDKIYNEYKSGKMTSGELKQIACEKMTAFMNDFTAKLEKHRKDVKNLNFVKFS